MKDIDGTLLTGYCEVHPKNREVINRIKEDYPHLPIILATGRDFNSACFVRKELGIEHFPTINMHGAMVHASNGDLMIEASVPGEIAVKILDYFISEDRFVLADMGHNTLIAHFGKGSDVWQRRLEKYKDCITTKVLKSYEKDKVLNGEYNVKRIFLPAFEYQIAPTLADINRLNDGTLSVTRTVSWALELLPADFNKGNALKGLCKVLDIDLKNVIAFGDAPNDIEMLTVAGFGVAMNSGFPQVKQMADYVACSNDDGGVGLVLEEIFYKSE